MRPKMIAPTGRVASARPTVSAMSGRDLPKAVATSWMTNVRTKKSKASSVQPRKPARTALRWFARSAAFMCGELYCPDDTATRSYRLRRSASLRAGHDREARRDCAQDAARARAGRGHARAGARDGRFVG